MVLVSEEKRWTVTTSFRKSMICAWMERIINSVALTIGIKAIKTCVWWITFSIITQFPRWTKRTKCFHWEGKRISSVLIGTSICSHVLVIFPLWMTSGMAMLRWAVCKFLRQNVRMPPVLSWTIWKRLLGWYRRLVLICIPAVNTVDCVSTEKRPWFWLCELLCTKVRGRNITRELILQRKITLKSFLRKWWIGEINICSRPDWLCIWQQPIRKLPI